MYGEVERVNDAWEMIEEWFAKNKPEYKLNPGASEEEIQKLETHLGQTIPDALKASLKRHNGVEEIQWPKGEFLSVESIIRDWDMRTGLFDSQDETDHKDGMIKSGWWRKEWIPIDADGAGNGACLDLAPGAKGQKGQIIDFDHECGPSGPNHEELGEYLEECYDELNSK